MSTENHFSTEPDVRNRVQETLSTVRERANDVVDRGTGYVRERPGTSVASAFIFGLAVGAVLAIALRPEPRKPTLADALSGSKESLADLLGTVADRLRDPVSRAYSSVSDGATSLADSLSHVVDKLPIKLLR